MIDTDAFSFKLILGTVPPFSLSRSGWAIVHYPQSDKEIQ
jgi:hypothetical protein